MNMRDEEKEKKPEITIRGAELLNIKVTSASHTVKDEKGKVLYEKRTK